MASAWRAGIEKRKLAAKEKRKISKQRCLYQRKIVTALNQLANIVGWHEKHQRGRDDGRRRAMKEKEISRKDVKKRNGEIIGRGSLAASGGRRGGQRRKQKGQ